MADTDDRHARAGRASHAARGWRELTADEAAHVARLGAEVAATYAAWQTALKARNAELRRLYADNVGPADMARLLPPDKGDGEHMSRTSVARIVGAWPAK